MENQLTTKVPFGPYTNFVEYNPYRYCVLKTFCITETSAFVYLQFQNSNSPVIINKSKEKLDDFFNRQDITLTSTIEQLWQHIQELETSKRLADSGVKSKHDLLWR